MPPFSTVFELSVTNVQLEMHSISSTLSFQTLKRIKFVTDAYLRVVLLRVKNKEYVIHLVWDRILHALLQCECEYEIFKHRNYST